MATTLEFMVRVKLPKSGSYHSSPSGDSEYEDAYNKAIADALPPGFEVCKARLNEKWPIDSEGVTYVPLRVTKAGYALSFYMERVKELETKIERIKKACNSIIWE